MAEQRRVEDVSDEPVPPEKPPRPLWLLAETRRSFLAVVPGVVVVLVVQRGLLSSYEPLQKLAREDPTALTLLLVVMVWAAYALAHTLLTWFAYRGLSGERFRAALEADPTWQRYERRTSRIARMLLGIGPSTWSIMLSLISLIAVAGLVLRPSMREVPFALGIALLMVAVSWVSVAVAYAVHYARVDQRRDGLEFPGEQPDTITDYVYYAIGVQATFGSTDVSAVTAEMRRQVMSQSVTAFVFNSAIVATIVSLLLGLG